MSKPVMTDDIKYLNEELDKFSDEKILGWLTLYFQTSCTDGTSPKYPGRSARAYMPYTDSCKTGKCRSRLMVYLDNGKVIDIGLHRFKKFLRR